MGIFSFFFAKKDDASASAGIAKERLQIVLAHERAGRDAPEFLPAMQRELLAVVSKYVAVKEEEIRVNLTRQDSTSVLVINVAFDPEKALPRAGVAAAAPTPSRASGSRAAHQPGKSMAKRR
jgi:cell division topological specificity factor